MNEKYIIGTTIGKVKSTAWFNSLFSHSMPLSLNTLNRAILKQMAGDECDISVVNKPFWLRNENQTASETRAARDSRLNFDVVGPILFLFFILSSYWPAIFIAFYIKERECRAKLLQYISGVNEVVYWVTSFLFDYTVYFTIMCVILGNIWIYQAEKLNTFEYLSRYLIIFGFYEFSILPFVYLFSYLFKKHSTGESLVIFTSLICKYLITVYKTLNKFLIFQPRFYI